MAYTFNDIENEKVKKELINIWKNADIDLKGKASELIREYNTKYYNNKSISDFGKIEKQKEIKEEFNKYYFENYLQPSYKAVEEYKNIIEQENKKDETIPEQQKIEFLKALFQFGTEDEIKNHFENIQDNQMLYEYYKLNLRSKEELSQFSRELEDKEKNLYRPAEKLYERIEKTIQNPVNSNIYYYFNHDELVNNNRFEREKISVFSDVGTNDKIHDPK
jgi:hypothetical protein